MSICIMKKKNGDGIFLIITIVTMVIIFITSIISLTTLIKLIDDNLRMYQEISLLIVSSFISIVNAIVTGRFIMSINCNINQMMKKGYK